MAKVIAILQELINKTRAALTDAGATWYYQRVFKQVCKQLLIYFQDMKADPWTGYVDSL